MYYFGSIKVKKKKKTYTWVYFISSITLIFNINVSVLVACSFSTEIRVKIVIKAICLLTRIEPIFKPIFLVLLKEKKKKERQNIVYPPKYVIYFCRLPIWPSFFPPVITAQNWSLIFEKNKITYFSSLKTRIHPL